jgi:hypothetical protein
MAYTMIYAMPKTAKLFKNGRSQAVRLPSEYRFAGSEVYVRRRNAGCFKCPSTFFSIPTSPATPLKATSPGFENGY